VIRAFLAGRSMTMRPTEALRSFLRRKSRTSRSSFNIRANAGRWRTSANSSYARQGDESRWDDLLTMDHLFLLGFGITDRHEDVTGLLANACAAALGPGGKTAQRCRLSTWMPVTRSSSMSAPSLCSALAIADSSAFLMIRPPSSA